MTIALGQLWACLCSMPTSTALETDLGRMHTVLVRAVLLLVIITSTDPTALAFSLLGLLLSVALGTDFRTNILLLLLAFLAFLSTERLALGLLGLSQCTTTL